MKSNAQKRRHDFQMGVLDAIETGNIAQLEALLARPQTNLISHPKRYTGIKALLHVNEHTSYYFFCVEHNQPKAVELLIKCGLDLNDSNAYPRDYTDTDKQVYPGNALNWAIHKGHLEVAAALSADANSLDNCPSADFRDYCYKHTALAQLERKAKTGPTGARWVAQYLAKLLLKVKDLPISHELRLAHTRTLITLCSDPALTLPIEPFVPFYTQIREALENGLAHGSKLERQANKHPFFRQLTTAFIQSKMNALPLSRKALR